MSKETKSVNNDFYDLLGDEWYERFDHPIALLRSENKTRNPWISEVLSQNVKISSKILDIGCGGGLLTSYLAEKGYQVYGIDLSQKSLDVAILQDTDQKISYLKASAEKLPYDDMSFDAVCMMDLLEHVDDYSIVIQEASRVLKPGGILFFHTFNRNLLSKIVIINGVEWFVKNTPNDMHIYEKFIKPSELKKVFNQNFLEVEHLKGLIPNILSKSFLKLLLKREIDGNFSFKFCRSLKTGYVGYARKTQDV